MKVEVIICSIFWRESPPGLREALNRICSEACSQYAFDFAASESDGRVESIERVLKDFGYSRWPGKKGREVREYQFAYLRQYQPADFESAEFLIPVARKWNTGLYKRWPDPAVLTDGRIPLGAPIAIAFGNFPIVVSSKLRWAMRREKFIGPTFQKMKIERGLAYAQYWELGSNKVLPPLSPVCTLLHQGGAPFTGDLSRGCYLDEGLFRPAELHYSRADINAFGDFDVAFSQERFGIVPPVMHPEIIVSKRFYQFCVRRKLKVDWLPVRVD